MATAMEAPGLVVHLEADWPRHRALESWVVTVAPEGRAAAARLTALERWQTVFWGRDVVRALEWLCANGCGQERGVAGHWGPPVSSLCDALEDVLDALADHEMPTIARTLAASRDMDRPVPEDRHLEALAGLPSRDARWEVERVRAELGRLLDPPAAGPFPDRTSPVTVVARRL
jgi:hypothetical protein